MVHTYRDGSGRQRSVVSLLLGLVCVGGFVITFGWGIIAAFADGVIWQGVGLLTFVVVVAVSVYKSRQRACLEIRLSDDGTCELETRGGVIRLHVNEISSVEYDNDDETGSESYTIRYKGGKTVCDWLTQFPDFFAHLQALNPAVDLSDVPVAWPNREAEASGPCMPRSLASAIFPVAVIIFIALIAWHTLFS